MCKVFYEDGGGKIMAIGGLCGAKIGLKKVMIKGGNYLCYDCVKIFVLFPFYPSLSITASDFCDPLSLMLQHLRSSFSRQLLYLH